MDENKSTIAQIRAQIELECQAIQNLRLFSIGASHEVIRERYQRLTTYHDQLTSIIGDDQATEIIVEIYDKEIK